ncbi:MAG: hypothetical protein A2383_00460 [Candidatus Pacebacteria bacterium RIFOXYB1_FULL_39_46]|nr:MAG: hypothetical protein A2182_00290 [Candidatus Pacebacteria bacterium RIFOXYA1_FULL_38_18]OGJ38060.1 MAG: hypothetical protein A2383_00460 [Candidatus Pacebacteria bacterium RIFOXYB1_FULL_39_46]OGJ39717.1 MAG: hypothetical protein A2411_02985 [Candidatus Pacebacteria bacterium RIFOXYC1_FULL_39_21]OGJ39812.1 MAG: hypothetical protein A2582_00225 [Candidatus Pacebacteria bacterium RIFOXYD1_FULL_39_27]
MTRSQLSPQLLARRVVLVNEQDEEIGSASLIEAHQKKGLLHRASSVFLFRKKNGKLEFLIQQRSPQKVLAANLWANTVCGNVTPKEDCKHCITRRLREELGIEKSDLTKLVKYRYQVDCGGGFAENEIDQIFVGWYDGSINPDTSEVIQAKWVDWQSFLAFIQKGTIPTDKNEKLIFQQDNFAPWIKLMFNEPQVLESLEKFIKQS